jgi:hypothetical protein
MGRGRMEHGCHCGAALPKNMKDGVVFWCSDLDCIEKEREGKGEGFLEDGAKDGKVNCP